MFFHKLNLQQYFEFSVTFSATLFRSVRQKSVVYLQILKDKFQVFHYFIISTSVNRRNMMYDFVCTFVYLFVYMCGWEYGIMALC